MNRIVLAAQRVLARLDLLGGCLRARPLVVGLGFALAGIVLAVLSAHVGIAHFWAKVRFTDPVRPEHFELSRKVLLGYMDHPHYGLWYLIGCPLFVGIAALTVRVSETASSGRLRMAMAGLSRTWPCQIIGLLMVVFFCWKNIAAEFGKNGDYWRLGLGFVQAELLADAKKRLEATNIQCSPAPVIARPRYYRLRDHESGRYTETRSVEVDEVGPPDFEVRPAELIAFVVVAKTLVGVWEGIAGHFSFLALLWSCLAFSLVARKMSTLRALSWTTRPLIGCFLVGVLANVFMIARVLFNRHKGSFGSWDQYWSFIVATPGVIAIVFFVGALALWFRNIRDRGDPMDWWAKILVGGAWLLTIGFLARVSLSILVQPWYDLLASIN